MLRYIFKRILIFIPTLIVISLLAFMISINAPGDPVERMLTRSQGSGEQFAQVRNTIEQKKIWTKRLGLDLPVFYFNISNAATPDTLYKIYSPTEKYALQRLIGQYGNWKYISAYHQALQHLNIGYDNLIADSVTINRFGKNAVVDAMNLSKSDALSLVSAYEENIIRAKLNGLKSIYSQFSFFAEQQIILNDVIAKYETVTTNKTTWKNYIPAIHFYKNNQYHRWIFGDGNWITGKNSLYCRGIIRGDFGLSYQTQLPIDNVISERLPWSLTFTIISVLLAYLISLPIGIKAAAKKNSMFDRTSSVILFILYSMPAFWFATLLLMTFANPHILQIFPASGVQPVIGIPEDATFFERIKLYFPYLILPTICYTYSQLAFLSRITRVSTLEVISQDYIRTARAKGLSEHKVIYKHAFRNSLLPIITVLSNILPLAIGGSVILETIFTIPGMGKEIFFAISNKDYPMIITVFTITGILTLIGYLIADILYAVADPRISYK
ncbi:MAG: ABC transporter permease subunit [Fimbriimonadaceae bacterium]|nr:ABC transporter permease subunit [Chitinophagales bacterium]